MPPAIPTATYRIQLTKDFGFDDAAALAPYLKQLGISHLYASPFLKARPGSTHGYDIVDHERLNPELGGEEGFTRLSEALKQSDLGLILDFVPNHMGVGHADNAWWLDVLEWGPKSPYAAFFDIDWDALPHRRHPGVLLPILGTPYGDALQACEIELRYDAAAGSFDAWYLGHKLPINPQRYRDLVHTLVQAADASAAPAGKALIELVDNYADPAAPTYREAPAFKRHLAEMSGAAEIIERGLPAFRGDHESGTALFHRLLERQYYRLAYWRVAFSAVNYRRFFDVSDLAGLRVENPAAFRAIHGLVARLIAEDQLQGLRLDHIDGLRDPAQYVRRLRQLIGRSRKPSRHTGAFYVVVEKILGEDEALPRWPSIAGTTGYEWLNVISRVLLDGEGLAALETTWRAFTGERAELPTMIDDAKRRVIDTMLASEFTVLARALSRIAAGHFSTRDYTLNRLREALLFYVLEFPVYRSYVTAAGPSALDRQTIEKVITRARMRWQGPDPQIFDFLCDAVTLDLVQQPGYSAARIRNFAFKLQQFTGPLMAKALEDTVFYRHHRLLALNEVGGNPEASALSPADFHRLAQRRIDVGPDGLTATATHDTKRGEDARMRILSLAELAAEWDAVVSRWRDLNAPLLRRTDGHRVPSPAHEYMLYQALLGAWPGAVDRTFIKGMQEFALKAAREAKQDTSWINPNADYEKGLNDFVKDLLDSERSSEFLAAFTGFAARIALLGALNGLSQLALKTLMPGVPDFYQGSEFWDLSLVDPDNRRPVDFEARKQALMSGLSDLDELATHWKDGRIKLALMQKLLWLRREFPELLRRGSYEPLNVVGPRSGYVIAFTRRWKNEELLIAVARHFAPITNGGRQWFESLNARLDRQPEQGYRDLLGTCRQADTTEVDFSLIMRSIPVVVLGRRG